MPGDSAYFSSVRCLSPIWRKRALREAVSRQSRFNRDRVLGSLYGKYGTVIVNELVQRIENSCFFAVNLSLESLKSVWRDGRMKSFWETGTSGMSLAAGTRDELERRLGIRSSGESGDPHPIYGAVGFTNGRDEVFGPATGYGECHLRLKEKVVAERAVFLYGDLGDTHLGQHGQRLFGFADVHVARAKVEIDRDASYVEMQVFGGVRISDIAAVILPAERIDKQSIDDLRRVYPDILVKLV
jgi:hypothetical protein